MAELTIGNVPAREAISNIQQKLRIPTKRWDDLMGDAHAKAFTVAGATRMDLLGDLHQAVSDAIEQGQSIQQFRTAFDDIVERHGWQYKGSRGWRTRVIYDTNLRTAHMAGRWKQIQRTKTQRPWLIYMTVGDQRVRPEHASWHGQVLHADDPWWDTHYPPNGFGCRCYTNTANDRQLERQGLEPDTAPPIKSTERVNTRTGEFFGEVPEGIDPGWNYNVGKAWIGSDVAFGQKLMQLPPMIRDQVLANNQAHIKQLSKSWQVWLGERSASLPSGYAHTVGYLPTKVIDTLQGRRVDLAGAAIIVFDRQTSHLLGSHKAVKKRIPPKWLRNLPAELADYQAVLLHKGDLVFVLKETTGGRSGRAIVAVNFKRKGEAFNSVRSLSSTSVTDLRKKDYELIDGKL